MKTKIMTKITKWVYIVVVLIVSLITAPLWLTMGVIDNDGFNNGLNEGLKVIGKIVECIK